MGSVACLVLLLGIIAVKLSYSQLAILSSSLVTVHLKEKESRYSNLIWCGRLLG